MSHNAEASSSNPPFSSEEDITFEYTDENVDSLINVGCYRLREHVKSIENSNILTFYSALIVTAFDAINATIEKSKPETLFPTVKDIGLLSAEPFAYEYYFMKACYNFKEIRTMISNSILTGSSTENTEGGSEKVLMLKNKCYKNIRKIRSLMEDKFFTDFYTWFDGFVLYGAMNTVACLLICLYEIMKLKELEDDGNFLGRAENISGSYEKLCRDLIFLRLGKVVERVKEQNKSVEELGLTGFEEKDALKKSQRIDEMLKIIKEQLRDKDFRDAESLNKLQEVEAIVKIQTVDFQKKAQISLAQKKLQEEEEKKKLQEEEALKKSQEGKALEKLHEEETQKNDKKPKPTRKHKKKKHVHFKKDLLERIPE